MVGGNRADGALKPIVFCGVCGAYGRRQTHVIGKDLKFLEPWQGCLEACAKCA